MKMRKFVYTLVFTIAFLGCTDFLDQQPLGQLTDVNFPTTQQDIALAVNGIYNTLRIWNFHEGGYPISDIMSDDARKGSSPPDQLPTIGTYVNFTFDASEGSIDRWWRTLYQGIKRSLLVTSALPNIQMNSAIRNRYEAEARFFKGYFYFILTKAWGDVPKVTDVNPPRNLGRTSKDEIYRDIIIPDLLFAIQHLPEKTNLSDSELGRATKGAARGILAKAYLYQGDFVNAETYAMEVINSGQYILDPSFSNVFSVDGEFGPESILEIGAIPEESFAAGGNQYGNTMGVRGTPNLGWGFGRPSIDLIRFYDEDDPRMNATVIFVGEVIDGITIVGDGSTPNITYVPGTNEILEMETYNQKVFTPGTSTRFSWGHNRRLLRYADVLLMAAEALNENNKPAEALIYLNMVRARAREGNPAILPDVTVTDKDLLRNEILDERRRELAMEAQRYWDLVRTGRAAEVLGSLGFVAGRHELLPIPQSEVDISEGAIRQNPSWD
jgi:starch-binding outer membrane protein, SusD/RagB family